MINVRQIYMLCQLYHDEKEATLRWDNDDDVRVILDQHT